MIRMILLVRLTQDLRHRLTEDRLTDEDPSVMVKKNKETVE